MRFHLASVGRQEWNLSAVTLWHEVVAQDSVRRHTIVDDAAEADRIVFVDLQQHPDDPYLFGLRRHPLVRSYRHKVVVYDQRDRPVRTFPGVYVSAERRIFPHRGVVGGPYPHLHTTVEPFEDDPDLLWTFSGARTHPVRDVLLSLTDPRGLARDTSAIPMFSDALPDQQRVAAARGEYRTLLSRSAFVLCPRGHGPSSFRLFETLAAGRVPVVISDSWLPPPRIDWETCIIRVAERDAGTVPTVLREAQHQWPRRAAAVRSVWQQNFAPDRIWDHIAQSLAEAPRRRGRVPWWAQSDVLLLEASRRRRRRVGFLNRARRPT